MGEEWEVGSGPGNYADPSPILGQPEPTNISGAHPSNPIEAAIVLLRVRGKVSPCLGLA